MDLPGYGYAKLSRSQTEKWGKMMEDYLENRPNLVRVVLLVDCRHEPSAQDVQMYEYLHYYGLDGIVAATKADKISKNKLRVNERAIRSRLSMAQDDILIPVSSLSRTGVDELTEVIGGLLGVSED